MLPFFDRLFIEHVRKEYVFRALWRLNNCTRISLQPARTFAVCRGVSVFATTRALLFQKFRTSDGGAKFRPTFCVMRPAFFEREATVHAKLAERASHFCCFRLGLARYGSRKVDFLLICRAFCFFFIIPDILETYWAKWIPKWDCSLQFALGHLFQSIWRESSKIQAAVFGFRNGRR